LAAMLENSLPLGFMVAEMLLTSRRLPVFCCAKTVVESAIAANSTMSRFFIQTGFMVIVKFENFIGFCK
jgi:hypothetical protein